MSETPVYLAFPDGVLSYDCAACDQRCCKTGGLAVLAREHELLVRSHPALELVAPPPGTGDVEVFATPPCGCWFLEGGRCQLLRPGVERHNRNHTPPRPTSCTLFPFNLFAMLGDTLVVAPNSLCPLNADPRGGVTHAEVLDLIGHIGTAGSAGSVRAQDGNAIVLLENILCAATATMLEETTPLPFLAFMRLATQAFLAGGDDQLRRLVVTDLDLEPLIDRIEHMAAVAGFAVPPTDAFSRITPALVAWSPSLRLFAFEAVHLRRLPEMLLALSLYAAHWQGLRPERPLLPQALAQMASALAPTLTLLATWEDPWPAANTTAVQYGEPPSETLRVQDLGAPGLERTERLRGLAAARSILEEQ